MKYYLETKVNDLRSALRYHGQQNTYYIEKIYANSDLDSVFTKTLECLGGITIKSQGDSLSTLCFLYQNYWKEYYVPHLRLCVVSGFCCCLFSFYRNKRRS
jgi:hypothetical protein